MSRTARPMIGSFIFFTVAFALCVYFTFAAIQGDFGVFERAKITAEARDLREKLDTVSTDVARMENLTQRLSDGYLDLDLLDEQARDLLGMVRSDEIVIR